MVVPSLPKQFGQLSWHFHPVSSCVHVSGMVVLVMCWTKRWEPGCFLKCRHRFQNTGDKLGYEFFLFKPHVCISLPYRKQVVFRSLLYTKFLHAGDCMEMLCGFCCLNVLNRRLLLLFGKVFTPTHSVTKAQVSLWLCQSIIQRQWLQRTSHWCQKKRSITYKQW